MRHLFSPLPLGGLTLSNRLVQSATYEGMAAPSGEVTAPLITRYRHLARGGTGLVIPGYFFVHPSGKAMKYQSGIHDDAMLPGLRQLTEAVHGEGGKIVFQLAHAGGQTTGAIAGSPPMAPSVYGRDPVTLIKPKKMKEKDITRVLNAFASAAARAVAAGADGIQLHAAHGYLINQFLSPFFNRRRDAWGGTEEKRFRFLKSTITCVRREMPEGMPLLVKMNTMDYTPKPGIDHEMAVRYAKRLAQAGIDGLEVSCGTGSYSFMNMCRGQVPVAEMVSGLPLWKKPVGKLMLSQMAGRFDLEEGYNLAAARRIRSACREMPLAVVGGFRRVEQMEEVLEAGHADLIAMARPFIREPFLARRFREEKQRVVTCVSCNKCLAAAANGQRVYCRY